MTETVAEFFRAYRDHAVDRMVGLCSYGADFRYVPVENCGRQRVIRAEGKVGTVGKVLWSGMIDAFPNLTNTVTLLTGDDRGNVAAEVLLEGTQAKDWGKIGNRTQRFNSRHLFIFHVNDDALIDSIVAYWDEADLCRQLGHREVD